MTKEWSSEYARLTAAEARVQRRYNSRWYGHAVLRSVTNNDSQTPRILPEPLLIDISLNPVDARTVKTSGKAAQFEIHTPYPEISESVQSLFRRRTLGRAAYLSANYGNPPMIKGEFLVLRGGVEDIDLVATFSGQLMSIVGGHALTTRIINRQIDPYPDKTS